MSKSRESGIDITKLESKGVTNTTRGV